MGWIGPGFDRCSFCLLSALLWAALGHDHASAQTAPAKPETPVPKQWAPGLAPKNVAPAQPDVAMPEADKIVLLIRSTLGTLNDALQTGNFTVLRDMGAPAFRDANTAARLAQIFAPLVSQGVDLAAVTILAPQLTEVPTIDPQRKALRLKGHFPGQPVQINFEIVYEPVAGRWRLFGLSVNAVPPATAAAPTPAPQTVAPAAKVAPVSKNKSN